RLGRLAALSAVEGLHDFIRQWIEETPWHLEASSDVAQRARRRATSDHGTELSNRPIAPTDHNALAALDRFHVLRQARLRFVNVDLEHGHVLAHVRNQLQLQST